MGDRSITGRIEQVIRSIGRLASWFCLALVALVCGSIVLRYVLGISSLAFDELQWHINAASWLLGFSYVTVEQTHVRNDILFNRVSELNQKRIDLWGHLLLVLPFVVLTLFYSWEFVTWAWKQNEGSIDPGGLSDRWIIKSFLLIGFTLFGIATITRSVDLARKISDLKKTSI